MRETTLINVAEDACTENGCSNPAVSVMIIIRDQSIEEQVSVCPEHRDEIGADRHVELVTMPLALG